MSRATVGALLLAVAVIHLLPVAGVTGAPALARLYGVQVNDPPTLLLLRHRALLFGLLGAFMGAAAFRPAWQPAALAVGIVSVGAFLWMARLTGPVTSEIARVMRVDVVALAALLVAAILRAQTARFGVKPPTLL